MLFSRILLNFIVSYCIWILGRTFEARHISIETRKSILRGIDQGMRQVELAKLFNVSRVTISVFLKRVSTCGVIGATPNPGRSRMTTRVTDRNILRMSRANPRLTASDIQSESAIANQQIPSVRTVRRLLQDAGLNGRRPAKKPLISKKNRVARVKWTKEHIGWTRQQWNKVLFSDESKFNLMGSGGIKYVRRPAGKRFYPMYQLPTVKHGGGNNMLWGCFSSHGVGPPRQIHGSLDRYGYEKILETTMRPFALQIIGKGFIFQQDNDPKHTSSHIRDWFNRRYVEVLDWPSQSPDLKKSLRLNIYGKSWNVA
ncbi:hypothetical protein RB195_025460 [Necator americanus]|uniref:Paired domain-containing protein n=1 Tax=Necator americanus TaxID=51031 RepID=A0ABR1ESE0_NECAM